MSKNRITDDMAEAIKECMNATVDKGTIKQVVRGYFNASMAETKARNNIILGHYQKLSEIERRHKEDMMDEIKEYIEKAKACNGKTQI